MAQAIQQGNYMAVCDSSFQEELGTVAWIVTNNLQQGIILGMMWAQGYQQTNVLFCSEHAGIYSIVQVVTSFANIT